ncbi:nucleotidyltransferase domain-containing protein [Candidatus Palauibacter sp.]|uniref:nucleotidyltransferase domain-containing protein n=1 Tax=Candidatus Palauibacter sp. TaxID=3101350 RepID=UPI003C6EAE06
MWRHSARFRRSICLSLEPPAVTASQAVWLYGSHARGDAKSDSDFDVLVIEDPSVYNARVQDVVATFRDASISCYSWNEILGMAGYGSLFLHHLRLEGRPLFEDDACHGRFRRLLDELPQYKKVARDLRGFRTVLADVRRALTRRWDDPFELSVLGTIVRHSAILGCWMHGRPHFGRTRPVEVMAEIIGFHEDWTDFGELYRYRLYCDRRTGKEELSTVDWRTWWTRARLIVDHSERTVDGNRGEVLK